MARLSCSPDPTQRWKACELAPDIMIRETRGSFYDFEMTVTKYRGRRQMCDRVPCQQHAFHVTIFVFNQDTYNIVRLGQNQETSRDVKATVH